MHLPVVPAGLKQMSCAVGKPKKIPKVPSPGTAGTLKEVLTKREIILNSLRIVREKKAESRPNPTMKKQKIAEPPCERPENVVTAMGAVAKPLANYKIPKKKSDPACSGGSAPLPQACHVDSRTSSDSSNHNSPDSPTRPVQLSPQTPLKQPSRFPRTPMKTLPLDRILEDMDKTHGPPSRKRSVDADPEKTVHPVPNTHLAKCSSVPSIHSPSKKQFISSRSFHQERPMKAPVLCKHCKRRYASDSSSDGTCVACRLNKDITDEQANLKTSPHHKKSATMAVPAKPKKLGKKARNARKDAKKKDKLRRKNNKGKKGIVPSSGSHTEVDSMWATEVVPVRSTPVIARSASSIPSQSAACGVCDRDETFEELSMHAKSNNVTHATNGSLSLRQIPAESHIPGSGGVCDESDETVSDSELWSSVKAQKGETVLTLPAVEVRTNDASEAVDDCGDDADTQGIASECDSGPEWIVIEDSPCSDPEEVTSPCCASPAPSDQDCADVIVVEKKKDPVEVINIDDLSGDEACEETPQSPQGNMPFSLSIESGMLSVTFGSEACDLDKALSVIRARTEKEEVACSIKLEADAVPDSAAPEDTVCSTNFKADDTSENAAPEEIVHNTNFKADDTSDNAAPEKVVHSTKFEAGNTSDDVAPGHRVICDQGSDSLQGSSSSAFRAPVTDSTAVASENPVMCAETDKTLDSSRDPDPSELLADLYSWPEDKVGTRAADALMQKYVNYIDKVFDLLENCDAEMRSVLVGALVPHGFLSLKKIMDLIQAITEKTGCEDTVKASSLGLRIFTILEGLQKPQVCQDQQPKEATETPTANLEPSSTNNEATCENSADLDSRSNGEMSTKLEEILQGIFSNSILKSLPLEQLFNDISPEVPITSPQSPKVMNCEQGNQPAAEQGATLCAQSSHGQKKGLRKTVGSQTEDPIPERMPKQRNMKKIPKAMIRPRKPSNDDQVPSRPSGSSYAASRAATAQWHAERTVAEQSLNTAMPRSVPSSVSFQRTSPTQSSAPLSWNTAVPCTVSPSAAFQQATSAQKSAPLPWNTAVPCTVPQSAPFQQTAPAQNSVPSSLSTATACVSFQHTAPAQYSGSLSWNTAMPSVPFHQTTAAQNSAQVSQNTAMPSVPLQQTAPTQNSRPLYGIGNYHFQYPQAYSQNQLPVQSHPVLMSNTTPALNSTVMNAVPYQYSNYPYYSAWRG